MMHAIRIGTESLQSLSIKEDRNSERGETRQGILSRDGEWSSKHTLSRGSGRATNRLVGRQSWRDAHKKPKTISEALRTKGRNPIESSIIQEREVTMNRYKQTWGEK